MSAIAEAIAKIRAATEGLTDEEKLHVGAGIARGTLETALQVQELAPMLAGIMDVRGVLILLVEGKGVYFESTSRDDDPIAKAVIDRVHETVGALLETEVGKVVTL